MIILLVLHISQSMYNMLGDSMLEHESEIVRGQALLLWIYIKIKLEDVIGTSWFSSHTPIRHS